MKYTTSELEGDLLDAAVAKAAGYAPGFTDFGPEGSGPAWIHAEGKRGAVLRSRFKPSTDWSIGGQIIERERITIVYGANQDLVAGMWDAWCGPVWASDMDMRVDGQGPTALIAAMRAYVASELGEEVDLP